MRPRVVLRAASGPSTGMGHAVRTAAVARAVRDGGGEALVFVDDAHTVDALRASDPELDARIAHGEGWLAQARAARSVWLDGFRDWGRELATLGEGGVVRFLVENRESRERADFVVYPALHHVDDDWDRAHAERVLAGAPWIPLAPEVAARRPAETRDVDLLVTMGGSDPLHTTERVLAALADGEEGLPTTTLVSVGRHMEPRRAAIEALASAVGGARVLPAGTPLGPVMTRCRRAVTALGTTLYELAHLRVPALVVANYEADEAALAFYREHGPHRPLGLAPGLTDEALGLALREGLAAPGPTVWPADLGRGAIRLAARLLAQAPSSS